MIKFINKLTGGEMWVADDRKEEYLSAGHSLAEDTPKAEDKPAKTTRKRGAKK